MPLWSWLAAGVSLGLCVALAYSACWLAGEYDEALKEPIAEWLTVNQAFTVWPPSR